MSQSKRRKKIGELPSYTMFSPKERLYNCVWTFHKYDEDFLPSVPHGHSGEYKLDVNNGNVYNKSSDKAVGHATKKELDRLHRNKDFQQFTKEHIAWYKETFPSVPVQEPAWLHKDTKNTYGSKVSKTNDVIRITLKIVIGSK